ncbi:hypothetical protein [uncultured Haemophilus sp.]|mgnify:FL=1|jgi:hypothetical protein|uniref:hypothetical protein n=1 Tax=uncultured Haemophilus sp. TaxID=237779 RepID=UPI0025F89000|nr:hypothetical protein [uncultured Haemophilus sp.]
MRKVFLLLLYLFIFSNVLAKDEELINPCAKESVPLNNVLSHKSILLNNRVEINNTEMFLVSYLDNRGDVCYDKKYDVFFNISGDYVYSKKLFAELGDVYPEINKSGDLFTLDFEYGNGQSNLERYYFNVHSHEVYIIKKDIIQSRTGESKVIKFKDLNIKDAEFSKLLNVY